MGVIRRFNCRNGSSSSWNASERVQHNRASEACADALGIRSWPNALRVSLVNGQARRWYVRREQWFLWLSYPNDQHPTDPHKKEKDQYHLSMFIQWSIMADALSGTAFACTPPWYLLSMLSLSSWNQRLGKTKSPFTFLIALSEWQNLRIASLRPRMRQDRGVRIAWDGAPNLENVS